MEIGTMTQISRNGEKGERGLGRCERGKQGTGEPKTGYFYQDVRRCRQRSNNGSSGLSEMQDRPQSRSQKQAVCCSPQKHPRTSANGIVEC